MLAGAVVTAAVSDPTQAAGVFITAGRHLYAVSLLGDVTRLGELIDALSATRSAFTPATIIFSAYNAQCSDSNDFGGRLADRDGGAASESQVTVRR